ncbi:tensin-1-like [Stomoxys calcitrans]|uniref:tensin-1-like n=1 Tax=Stomoxys calcitrans TaxID=35570 RepID=UPI0027E31EEA|nr:tensin-1-like [Stomoxys calcitrans]
MATLEQTRNPFLNDSDPKHSGFESSDTDETENEIPYHAREHARPFTYGKLPKGFKKSDLNHVPLEDIPDALPTNATVTRPPPPALPLSPSTLRRNTRPSVSPSRPVIRKTPSREEFEQMLRERQEQSLREQNIALKEAQNASIQKDLDALQEKLNKRALLLRSEEETLKQEPSENLCREVVKLVETIDLPDEKFHDGKENFPSNAIVEAPSKYESALIVSEVMRPDTPSFPVASKALLEERCVSPYQLTIPTSPKLQRNNSLTHKHKERKLSPLKIPDLSSIVAAKPREHVPIDIPHDVAPHLVKFARDSSQFWYKPHMTREEAVAILRNAEPGTFIIRNSTTYKGAFGLVLRVATLPHGVPVPENTANGNDVLVRHFLLEPTTRGVRLKGCVNEPTFTSLSALVYQHSINQMALPCRLSIPNSDLMLSEEDVEIIHRQRQLLEQGAACNVLYLFSMNMESLTGDEAIRRAVHEMFLQPAMGAPVEVHFKVSQNGITLTDNKRRAFFRRHYTPNNISHIGLDPDNRFWSVLANDEGLGRAVNKTLFAFVARAAAGSRDNQCHIFCDLIVTQPASAIVSFAQKILHLNKNAELL